MGSITYFTKKVTESLCNFPKVTQLAFGRNVLEAENSGVSFHLLLPTDLYASGTLVTFSFLDYPQSITTQEIRTCSGLSLDQFF